MMFGYMRFFIIPSLSIIYLMLFAFANVNKDNAGLSASPPYTSEARYTSKYTQKNSVELSVTHTNCILGERSNCNITGCTVAYVNDAFTSHTIQKCQFILNEYLGVHKFAPETILPPPKLLFS